jgi:hypothetical protein
MTVMTAIPPIWETEMGGSLSKSSRLYLKNKLKQKWLGEGIWLNL